MAFGLTITVTPARVQLKPGGTTQVSVTITNVSDIVEHYQVALVGLPSHDYWTSEPALTKLRPKESGTVTLAITLPDQGGILGGRYVLGVFVTSPYQPDVARSADLVLHVSATSGISLTATPLTATDQRTASYTLLLTNNGNTDAPLHLTATDENGRATVHVTPTSVHIPPGTATAAHVTVQAPTTLTGPERRSTIAVTAHTTTAHTAGPPAAGETRGEVKLTLIQPPLIPPTLFRILGMMLAVTVMAAAILTGSVLGRQADPAATAAGTPTAGAAGSSGGSGSSSGSSQSSSSATIDLSPISVEPSTPVVGEEAVLSATATGQPEAWKWTIRSPDGQEQSSTDAGQVTHTFEQPGTWTVTLVVTDNAGQPTAETLPVEVVDVAPRFAVATKVVEVEPGSPITNAAPCSENLLAVGGGVSVAGGDAAPASVIQSSVGTGNGNDLTQWSAAVLNSGTADVEVTISAICAESPSGYDVITDSETVVEPSTSEEKVLRCPDGLVPLGGGGGIRSETVVDTQSLLEESLPVADAEGRWTGWRVRARNNGAAAQHLTAQLVCGDEPDDYSVQPSQETLAAATGQRIRQAATCPSGTALSGGSGVTQGSRDPETRLVLEQSGPAPSGSSTPAGWAAGLTFTAPVEQSVTSYAVCASLPS